MISMADVCAQANNLSALTQQLCVVSKVGDSWFVNSFKAQDEGGLMSYASDNPNIAVNTQSGKITASAEGTAIITVTQTANKKYKAASSRCTLNVEKLSPLLSMSSIEKTFGDPDFDLVAPQSKSTGAVTYTSSDNKVANITGTRVTIVGASEKGITITATQAEDAKYKRGSTQTKMIVHKAVTELDIEMYYPSSVERGKREIKIVVTSKSKNKQPLGLVKLYMNNVFFAQKSLQENCVGWPGYGCVYFYVDGNKSGVIKAEYEADNNHQSSSANGTILQQTIAFANSTGTDTYGKEKKHLLPKLEVGQGNGQVSYSIATEPSGLATLDTVNRQVIIHGVGVVTVTATKTGDNRYSNASATYTLHIGKAKTVAAIDEMLAWNRAYISSESGRVPTGMVHFYRCSLLPDGEKCNNWNARESVRSDGRTAFVWGEGGSYSLRVWYEGDDYHEPSEKQMSSYSSIS